MYDKAERLHHGQRISDLITGYDAVIVHGPPTQDLHPGAAIARYGQGTVHLQQIVWPDAQGRFPWEHGYVYDANVQPVIGRP